MTKECQKMAEPIKKKLSQLDLNALIEWGVFHRSAAGEVAIVDIAERLQELGISKDKRTLFRYKEKIDTKFEERLADNKYSLDGFLDWEQKSFFDEFINPNHIWMLRQGCFNYEVFVTKHSKYQFPHTVTYRWAKWASYFLSAVPNPEETLKELDVWTVGQALASRDLIRSIGGDADNLADFEGWLMARPWESDKEMDYRYMISKGRYIPLKRLDRVVNPEKTTIERIGMPFLANAYMNVLSAPQLKDHDDYGKCYLLPSQQIEISKEAYGDKPPMMEVHISGFPILKIAF